MPMIGIEPITNWLKASCSTIELHRPPPLLGGPRAPPPRSGGYRAGLSSLPPEGPRAKRGAPGGH